MNLSLAFRAIAKTEFDAAAEWSSDQRYGLGDDFVAEVDRVLESIAKQPDRYPVAEGDVREAPVSRFPYCVYYRVKPERVVVLAVFHTSREPSVWQARE